MNAPDWSTPSRPARATSRANPLLAARSSTFVKGPSKAFVAPLARTNSCPGKVRKATANTPAAEALNRCHNG